MSIREYPKHQFTVEITNDESTYMMDYAPSFSGYLTAMRVKIIRKNYPSGNGRAKIIIRPNNSSVTISESSWINYSDIEAAETDKYWHSWIRFDFDYVPVISGLNYEISIYQESADDMTSGYLAYCLDYNYPVNTPASANNPFSNVRLAAEMYIKKDYYEFD
jgi:hypothetical protein